MTSTITPHTASPCFQLKGSMITMMTLELYRFDELNLHHQLQGLVAKAPRFFENTPVVVGLENLHDPEGPIDLPRLCSLCAGFGINLIAIRGGNADHRTSASDAGLACLPAQPASAARKVPSATHSFDSNPASSVTPLKKENVTPIHQNESGLNNTVSPEPSDARKDEPAPESPVYQTPKIISSPIRSGQQVFHDGDLILTGPVSTGAEVLVTGNLYAYGAFRGRALVGVKGNGQARIFCTHFEAELVSIHGHYKMAAAMDKSLWKQAVQVYLQDDSLALKQLT
ncbi:septum site-determining protein MinC [Parendozoicomonas sp. Alg238-R29]|uniref:septum site-determining protein MinC n=1 Tax=Parendozoicomonas sp. Alg238-R29 TaxID=2993446 RepID=UPI00248E27D5|nr:septum site-determining protein MinC [Parendozoicomonas sp. Alg238-R29]